jgi:hypothetical protein
MTSRLLCRIAALFAVVLAGCSSTPPEVRFADITFGHLPPHTLTVSRVDIESTYQAPMRSPNIEHTAPVSPERALRRWAQDRLKTSGMPGTARFIIVNASIVETPLSLTGGIRGAFTKEQAARYEATIEASLEVLDERGFRRGFATARVQRSTTSREDSTLNDRDRLLFTLVDELMKDFDREMERSMRQYLTGYMM